MGEFTVEKDWTTQAGLRAVVVMGSMGARCGYVGLSADHPLHGADYSEPHPALQFPKGEQLGKRSILAVISSGGEPRPDVVFNVHGGITYSGGSISYPAANDSLWWFGYDCNHADDAPSDEYRAQMREKYPDHPILWQPREFGTHRTLDYCERECESLASQLAEVSS